MKIHRSVSVTMVFNYMEAIGKWEPAPCMSCTALKGNARGVGQQSCDLDWENLLNYQIGQL